MGGDTTTLETDDAIDASPDDAGLRDGLVVVWSREKHPRFGEVLLVPTNEGRAFVFGRGEGADGARPRLPLVRQRPGENETTDPLDMPHLSRAQLVLARHPEGGIQVENNGKPALLVNQERRSSSRVRPGDLVEIRDHLLMLAVRRPQMLPPLHHADRQLCPAFGEPDGFGYVGESPDAWRLRNEIAVAARRHEHALVLGESGVGKEIVAQAIHGLSARATKRLVSRNAATIPAGIMDAELFGSAAHYPNAGMPERPGLVGEAEGSTLYLDEIGELPLDLQTHLLRLLDNGEYQRLGDARRRSVDVRVLAATNRPIAQLRNDLSARFRIRIEASGLHERREDVPLLARHLLREIAGTEPPELSKDLIAVLIRHMFTTHVRELGNVLYRAWVERSGDIIGLTPGAKKMLMLSDLDAGSDRTITKEAILDSLEKNGGVRERVWRDLGLRNRHVLKRLMAKFEIRDDDDR
jgi:two-component system nitrogen regulation response regulator GlnG/two-component system response regulator HydG